MFEHWTLWHTISTILLAGAGTSLKTGFFEGLGGWLSEKFRNHWPFNRRAKKREPNHLIQIGRLTQKVMDLTAWKKNVSKRLDKTEKLLLACQGERTECRADMRNLVMRISALERK